MFRGHVVDLASEEQGLESQNGTVSHARNIKLCMRLVHKGVEGYTILEIGDRQFFASTGETQYANEASDIERILAGPATENSRLAQSL